MSNQTHLRVSPQVYAVLTLEELSVYEMTMEALMSQLGFKIGPEKLTIGLLILGPVQVQDCQVSTDMFRCPITTIITEGCSFGGSYLTGRTLRLLLFLTLEPPQTVDLVAILKPQSQVQLQAVEHAVCRLSYCFTS